LSSIVSSSADVAAQDTLGAIFSIEEWTARLSQLAATFRGNQPGPHIYLADFLLPEAAAALEKEFPRPDSHAWTHYQHQNENKHGMTKRDLFPPRLGAAVDALNSDRFLEWLSGLTGIQALHADPMLEGGGLHQSGPGGYLNVHTDFSHHHYHTRWKRRINLILYLNEGWHEDWGGGIELWDSNMHRCEAKYPPVLNSALIFETTDASYHGFPTPLTCPSDQSRKSLALYYYTDDGADLPVKSTNYRARPQDGLVKSALIWADKKAVDLYSRAKARFGFSDELASRILGLMSRSPKRTDKAGH